ncbi:MAG: translation initiation factor IF-2 [Vicinamibacteria bacterium]|nr:translation initiation factor IF-2 [Vicinamibacteria bacterium]
MANVRVFQLARDLGTTSQEIVKRLGQLGVEVRTASSSVDEDTADKLKRAFKLDALTAKRRRVYGSEEDEAELEAAAKQQARKIAEEREAREKAAALAASAAAERKARKGKKASEPPPAVTTEAPPPALVHPPGAPRLAPRIAVSPSLKTVTEQASEDETLEHEEPAPPAPPRPAPPAVAAQPSVMESQPAPRNVTTSRLSGPARPIMPQVPLVAEKAAEKSGLIATEVVAPPASRRITARPVRPIAPARHARPSGPHPTSPHPTSPHVAAGGPAASLPRSPHPITRTTPAIARPIAPATARAKATPDRVGGTPSKRAARRHAKEHVTPTRSERPVYAGPPRKISVTEGVTVKELSEKMTDIKTADILKSLIGRGVMVTVNQSVDPKLAIEICKEFGYEAGIQTFEEAIVQDQKLTVNPENLAPRAPVVTVMGHVDHGKTSLLDAIRESSVATGEAGGITQHIGAYHVDVGDRKVVFLDTPGHEAFTLMRARGAKVTDVVVLVVAADDGVMPQTAEAIDHARAANVPIVVAVNKIDKPDAHPERVRQQLADRGLLPEEWGGSTVFVDVSAKQKQNLNLLLEMILLVADMLDLKADPKRPAIGTVLEARLDKGRGAVATVLVEEGTLRVGDTIVAGAVAGRIRALVDDQGNRLKSAGPATPVEVLGLGSVPDPGDQLLTLTDGLKAQAIVSFRQAKLREKAMAASGKLKLEELGQAIADGKLRELPLILKTDVQGSIEALADQLMKIPQEKIKLRIIRAGVGAITEGDILLAAASNAVVIGFNVRPERKAADIAERDRVDVRLHTVIYDTVEEIRKALEGLLEPSIREVRLGSAEVREVFKITKVGMIAGCYVSEGRITRSAQARLLRDNVVIHTGKIASLRRFKEDASEVKAGLECGIGLASYSDVKPGDIFELFITEQVKETLE